MSPTADMEAQIAQLTDTVALLQESLIDVERSFAAEDAGWTAAGGRLRQFTSQFRQNRTDEARIASVIDPLIKRAMALRCSYIWSGGVQVGVRDDEKTGQDVGAIVAAFWGDDDVQETLSSTQALIGYEIELGVAGEIYLALPTDPHTGRVRVRSLPPSEMGDVITDPEDAARPWYYPRSVTINGKSVDVLHPALTYRPRVRPASIDGKPVRWDAPVLHVAVNPVGGRGCGDLWAALPWSRAYKNFLTDWAVLMHALSRLSTKVRTRGDKAQQTAAKLNALPQTAGQGVTLGPSEDVSTISTAGARFDADSGRPLAVMVAAAVDLPVTTLLGDPGATGARAVAESVADESWAIFEMRRDLWASTLRTILGYVINAAVIAPYGPLRGTIRRDGDRQYAELPEGDSRAIIVSFAEHDDTALLDRVKAIQLASQTLTVPPLTVARLLLQALEVPDMDDVLAMITDPDTGEFLPLDVAEQRVRDRLAARGEA